MCGVGDVSVLKPQHLKRKVTEAGNGTVVLPFTAGPNQRTVLWSKTKVVALKCKSN